MASNRVGENRRVLIVDDSDAIQADFIKILGEFGNQSPLKSVAAKLLGDAPQCSNQHRFELTSAMQGRDAVEEVKRALDEGAHYAAAFGICVCLPAGVGWRP